jgi:hypothetical protein
VVTGTRDGTQPSGEQPTDPVILLVRDTLGRIRFGDVRLTVHEGRVVQMDVTERTRFSQS